MRPSGWRRGAFDQPWPGQAYLARRHRAQRHGASRGGKADRERACAHHATSTCQHARDGALGDDDAGFEQAQQAVLKLNPRYSRMYQIIGDFADWEHRYDEIVAMMRKAVQIDHEDAKAHAQLGLNLIRAGDDSAGLSALRVAFDKDPFNVRVFHAQSVRKDIPKIVSVKRFTIRYHKKKQLLALRRSFDRACAR
jgi:tetratricopeptide (TPR) repeat protein